MPLRPMAGGRPLRAPAPYDIKIGGVGYMLFGGAEKRGGPPAPTIQFEHPDPLGAAAPTEFDYSAQNPMIGATTVYDSLVAGFGQKFQQHRNGDHRYFFGSGVDLSIDGQITLGPQIFSDASNLGLATPSTVDSTNGIVAFFEIGGSLYALNGRYVLKWSTSTFDWNTVSKDFTAGKAGLDVVVTKQNGGSTTYAYVAMGDSDAIYKFDGTTWTQSGEALYARAFAIVGKELYRATAVNQLSKVDSNADPFVLANWSASNSFYVGDNQRPITRLMVDSSGTLVIAKTDGLYILDRDGNDIQLTSDLKLTPDNNNGKYGAFKYENYTHWTLNGRHFRLQPAPYYQMEGIGPERFAQNDSPVSGIITAGVGTPFAAYAGLWNPDTGNSYLLKYGAWTKNDDGTPQRLDVWHGSLSGVTVSGSGHTSTANAPTDTFPSLKITTMHRSTVQASTNHEWVWIGCSNGKIGHFALPCKPNPIACSSAFPVSNPVSGDVYLPYWHGGFPQDEKVITAVTTVGTQLASGASGYFADAAFFRAAGGGATYNRYYLGGASTPLYSVPGARVSVGRACTLEEITFRLGAGTAASTSLFPVVNAFIVHYAINPPIQLVCDVSILCENGVLKRDRSMMRIGADQIRSGIKTAAATTQGVVVIFPDETSLAMVVKHYREAQRWDQQTKQWRSVIVVRLVQTNVDWNTSSVAISTGDAAPPSP